MIKHIAIEKETHEAFNELRKLEGMTADGLLRKLISKFKEENKKELITT